MSNYQNSQQDWTPVIFKSNSKNKKNTGIQKNLQNIQCQKKFNAGQNKQNKLDFSKKIEEKMDNDTFRLPTISKNIKIQMQQSRQEKGLTQKQLAQKCNLPENIIKDYEQGKGIPNQQHLNKINKVLSSQIKL